MKKQRMILGHRRHRIDGPIDKELILMANFLTDDVQYFGFGSYMRWLKYWEQDSVSGNRSFLEKHKGKIYIRDIYDDDCGVYKDRFLIISPENLVAILEQWYKMCEQKKLPEYLTIIQADNGEIFLVPKKV